MPATNSSQSEKAVWPVREMLMAWPSLGGGQRSSEFIVKTMDILECVIGYQSEAYIFYNLKVTSHEVDCSSITCHTLRI